MLTLANYTQTLRPHIPLHSASQEAFERILTLTSYFPASLANHLFVIELHLREDETSVDSFVYFPNGNVPLLPVGATDPGHSWLTHPDWQKLYNFFAVWRDPASLLYEKTDQAWLSFDLNQPVPAVPVPGVFYCSTHPKADIMPTVALLTSIFSTPEEVALMNDTFVRCLTLIPEPARLNHVGFGLQRFCGSMRLQIVNFPPYLIPAYLEAIGWPYSTEPLQPILKQFSIGDIPSLMIDISTSIHPRIGLECALRGYDSRWQKLLDFLIEQELCQPDKRDFLVTSPGLKLCQMGDQVSLTRQRLSHVKVGYNPEQEGAPFEAKAYLAYYPVWLSLPEIEVGG
ncbi:hypothetical protein EPA93_16380 [Ktedonosporobacter rubrisoli]|uniref:Uncharacterized protein n=1 Tax=Ktedonosporobacter rubrisoli TaxID=2509675 RepID=A0A4V0YYU9_KTERU|nr:hypothetical protein [Ktedonosporobacter rubrisoli]QBD77481.1 hypothetical protein EPA93_16380 [Ktedonosporobacter rubrisoli]